MSRRIGVHEAAGLPRFASGLRNFRPRHDSKRWSTTSDQAYFKRIPEWKRGSKTKNEYDMYEKGRNTKIAARIIFFFCLNTVFILFATYIFMKIEAPYRESKNLQAYETYIKDWKPRNYSTEKLDKLRLIFSQQCRLVNHKPWNYFHAVHLSYSTITTIGFGEITARTFWGRLATMLYAMFGILLFIMLMASFRVLLITGINKVMSSITLLHARMLRRIRARSRRVVKVVFTLAVIIILWTISSCFTLHQNHWSWFLSLYNIFIAVTTIGFGDMVVIDNDKDSEHTASVSDTPLNIFMRSCFMVTIILILVLFSTLFEQLKQNNVQTVSKRISHLVNQMNQQHSRYLVIGPLLTGQARMPLMPPGSRGESVVVMPTIKELDSRGRDSLSTDEVDSLVEVQLVCTCELGERERSRSTCEHSPECTCRIGEEVDRASASSGPSPASL